MLALIADDARAALGLIATCALIVTPWLDVVLFLVLFLTYAMLFRLIADICALNSTFDADLSFAIIASCA